MIRDNIITIKGRIEAACARVNRDPGSVAIVAVSKNRTPQEIEEALKAGITDIGENRIQEAVLKYSKLRTTDYGLLTIKWHMVGHLQSNKAKEAVKLFDLIHSVDSVRLAREIDGQAAKINKVQDILIEIKTSEEAAKFGIAPKDAVETIREIARLKNIHIKGLMTIAPLADNPEKARPYFRALREIRNRISTLYAERCTLHILSMGMSDDFEVAIEEGATIVRIGRAIFEE